MSDPSAAMVETIDLVEPWLYSALSSDPQLVEMVGVDSISGTLSPEVLDPPYVTFLMQSTRDVSEVAGIRISTDNLYIVKAVAQTGSWDDVRPIANRISGLLHRPHEVVSLPTGSLTCTRERIVQYPEVDEGLQYRHLGAIFRIRASAGV